jgi:aldehyde:ferredoxin oxidoreductase
MGKIVRVDMATLGIKTEDAPSSFNLLGGRALTARIVNQEVSPLCHPLSAKNKLIFAPGLLSGTVIPNSGRISVGSKSPLTQTIKEANSGGTLGHVLAKLDIKALVIENKPKENRIYILEVSQQGISLVDGSKYKGLGNYALAKELREAYGKDVSIASIGPCGEMKMAAASIAFTDIDGHPCRHAARGGLGAVMGAKGLKAIVLDEKQGEFREPAREQDFKEAVKETTKAISEHPRTPFFRAYGTPGVIDLDNERGSLVTRNAHSGRFEGFKRLNAEAMIELQKVRGGRMGHACMRGCAVRCSPVYHDKDGNHLTSALEYETLVMLGSNLAIDDMDAVAKADRKCDDYGLDTIEMGATVGVLSESEPRLFEFGDSERLLQLLDEVGKGTTLGRILGQGVVVTCRVFGIDRVMAVKGQGIPGHSARSMKGLAVTYVTSPQGADHTAGFVPDDPLSPVGQVERSKNAQVNIAIIDSLGFCYFAFMQAQLGLATKLINAFCGENWEEKDLIEFGKKILREERAFNIKAGFNEASDRVPDFMKEEPLPPHQVVFDVPDEEIDTLFKGL